jgi:3-hydroxyisobutyrate dehydrogenase-like beta-hydroxyacid dehydrogenase
VTVGFAGLGIMGAPMALNLLRGGQAVRVWNRTPAACAPLVAEGAVAVASPAELAAGCAITFAMLADPAAAQAVACGPGGIVEGLAPGHGYIDMSTVDPQTSASLAAAVAACGGRFLEAPVSGSRQPAEQGRLVIMAAGDRALYDEAAPLLDLLGSKCLFLGEETGLAARMKLVVNLVMGGMMAAFAEGLALSRTTGLATADLLEVLDSGAVANPMFRGKGPRMLADDFAVAFPLKHMAKDLRLAREMAAQAGLALPTGTAAHDAFAAALAAGDGDLDFSAVFRSVPGSAAAD